MASNLVQQAQIELWVLEAQAGESAAFGALYQHFNPLVLGFAYKVTQDKELAQDAVQEAWIKLSKRLAKLDDPAAFTAWLFKLTHWQILDQLKHAKKSPLSSNNGKEQVFINEPVDASDLNEAIGRLAPQDQQIIHLFYLAGFSLNEISDILNIATGTVKSRLFRARQALKDTFDKESNHEHR